MDKSPEEELRKLIMQEIKELDTDALRALHAFLAELEAAGKGAKGASGE